MPRGAYWDPVWATLLHKETWHRRKHGWGTPEVQAERKIQASYQNALALNQLLIWQAGGNQVSIMKNDCFLRISNERCYWVLFPYLTFYQKQDYKQTDQRILLALKD